jgi:excisionase family DNA binding protein
MDTPQLLTVEEAATMLRLTPATVRMWARDGRLPSYKMGYRTLVDVSDLQRFIAAQKRVVPAEVA